MARVWNPAAFDSAYAEFICQDSFPFGTPEYYGRYRSRYRTLLESFCRVAPAAAADVLDFGGGQLALLSNKLWNDRAAVADLPGEPQLEYLRGLGITPIPWDLCSPDQPRVPEFDYIFFSEVIEHLPIPGHLALERLRKALKPGGILICSTPNLHRLRNIVHLILGLPVFDHNHVPEDGSLGHVIEYSRDDLQWQLERAGFEQCSVEYCQMHHSPTQPVFRVMAWLGYPLFLVPHFRDNLLAVAAAPSR